jgi:hypothetical protein
MKSIITSAAYTIAIASFFAVCAPNSTPETQNSKLEYPAATGIMLPEVTISSLPICNLREVVVSTKALLEVTLQEVVILATDRP